MLRGNLILNTYIKSIFSTAALQVLSKLIVLISGVLFARILGADQYGQYGLVLSIVTLLTLPIASGLPILLIREISQFRVKNELGYILGIIKCSKLYVLIVSGVVTLFFFISLNLGFFDDYISSLLPLALLLVPLRGLISIDGAIINGYERPGTAQLISLLIVPLLALIIVVVLLFIGFVITPYLLIITLIYSSILAVIIGFFTVRKSVNVNYALIKNYKVKSWGRALLPFSIMAIITTLNTEMASVVIGFIVDSSSVAYFKVAMQAMAVISLGLSSINAVIMPKVSRYYKQGRVQDVQCLVTKSVRVNCISTIPVILMLIFFGDDIILLLFGSQYVDAYPIMVILGFGQIVNVIMGSVGVLLNMTGNEKKVIKTLTVSLLVNVILIVSLTPILGAAGAAYGVSISMVIWNLMMSYDVYKYTGIHSYLR